MAVILDPLSFGATGVRSADDTRLVLEANGVITYVVHQGDKTKADAKAREHAIATAAAAAKK